MKFSLTTLINFQSVEMRPGHEYSTCSIACINVSPLKAPSKSELDQVVPVCAQAIIDAIVLNLRC